MTSPSEQDHPIRVDVENDSDLLREFANESHELLGRIEQAALHLEENASDMPTIHAMFASFHTIKGSAGLLNLVPVKNLAHELESVLSKARDGSLALTTPLIDMILKGADALKHFIQELEKLLVPGNKGGSVSLPTADLIAAIHAAIERPREAATPKGEAAEPGATSTARHVEDRPMVRVDLHKLDAMVDFVGELVITHSLVAQDVAHLVGGSERTRRNLAQLGYITGELQRTALSMRMVPIRPTFLKMNRLVRDLAAKAGKQVQLVTRGEETELDRTLVESLGPPLLHMVRNAIDHGIEAPAARRAAGKPETGTILLRALHKGGSVHIELTDDGAGLNAGRIRDKAVQNGLLPAEARPTDAELYKFIFVAGFSTMDKVSEISGRGVGMDVVRRNIEKLRGKIDIHSTPGRGCTFLLTLPLTLAIIDGMLVGVGPERYIIPTLHVRESFRPKPEAISTVQGRGELVNIRGHLSPLLRLYEHFNVAPLSTDPAESIIVRVEADQMERCLLVDRLLGKQEVVIKNLDEALRRNNSLAGAAILGDGRIGLILDVNALVHLGRENELADPT